MNYAEARAVEILLVEDSIADIELMQEGLKEGKVWHNLHVARDGAEAIEFLQRQGKYLNAPEPDLILLDLNMPKKDGREVLADIKADNHLSHIPVVILTTSQAEQDILRSYQLHANSYITKPVDLARFFEVIKTLEDFWFTVVRLPKHQSQTLLRGQAPSTGPI
jgi:two-component system, chemotaxis family, response regulator Rcp1